MPRFAHRTAALAAVSLLALGVASLPSAASAATVETDTATLSYTAAGWTCQFASSDGSGGACTLVSQNVVGGCLLVPMLVRDGSVSLVEPSGESVTLTGTAVGTYTQGTFQGSGNDGSGGGAFSGSCGHFGGLSSATFELTWSEI